MTAAEMMVRGEMPEGLLGFLRAEGTPEHVLWFRRDFMERHGEEQYYKDMARNQIDHPDIVWLQYDGCSSDFLAVMGLLAEAVNNLVAAKKRLAADKEAQKNRNRALFARNKDLLQQSEYYEQAYFNQKFRMR